LKSGDALLSERADRAVADLPEALVYAGFSWGAGTAQRLAQTRPGARGALLYQSCIPITGQWAFGPWLDGVPVQIHGMDKDPFFALEGDIDAARELVETVGSELAELVVDSGQRSRVELGDAVELSRSRLAVELERLDGLGLVETAGLAASRGGRRSSIVRIARHTRFLGVDIGATSIDVAVTDGELRVLSHEAEPIDIRQGPEVVLRRALELVGKLRAGDVSPGFVGAGAGVPGPVSFRDGVPVSPPIMPGWNR